MRHLLQRRKKHANNIYKLAMVGIAIIIFGGNFWLQTEIYPLDRIRGNLDGVTSSDPL